MAERETLTPCEQVRGLIDRHREYWAAFHKAADEDDAFLDGDRYENNEDYVNRDRRLIQIHGQETYDTVRHMVAVWSGKQINLQARPRDTQSDPITGEFMAALVEAEFRAPLKRFWPEVYKAVKAAWMHSCGIVFMDFEKDLGPWGEMVYAEEDMRGFMWDPSYHPHHLMNRWLYREKRIHVEAAREMYGAPWLEPDRTVKLRMGRPDRPLLRGMRFSPGDYDDDCVTVGQCWYKHDKTKKYRAKKNGKYELLPPDQVYMACAGPEGVEQGCGWRSPRQGDLVEALPEMVEAGCPVCGGNIERIDSLGEQEAVLAYSRGKRLIILAPNQMGPDDEALYDGSWPVPRARSYPALFVFAEERPGRPMGGSAPSQSWDMQMALDQLRTMAVQQGFESQPIYIFPGVGLTDRDGQRFELRDDQERVAYRDDSNQFMQKTIERFEGGGIDPAIPIAHNLILSSFSQNRGVADLGLTEESSKDIAASTVAQITKQEELPSADFKKRTSMEIGIFAGIDSDYITATYPPQRVQRLNIEGTDLILPVWGQDLPGYDFELEDSPEFTGQEKARVDALTQLDQIFMEGLQLGLSPELLSQKVALYAEQMHFPPSVVSKFQQYMLGAGQEMMAKQAEAAAAQDELHAADEEEAAADIEAGVGVPGFQASDAELEAQSMGAEGAPA